MAKRKILINSSLFFNRIGNQSFFETVKEYSNYYDVYILTTSSNLDDYYLSFSSAKEKLPANVYLYRTPQYFHTVIRKISNLFRKKSKDSQAKVQTDLINLRYTRINYLSLKLANVFSVLYLAYFKYSKKINFDIICAYEIGEIDPVLLSKKYFFKSAITIAKMQGTVLMPVVNNGNDEKDLEKKYFIDFKMYRKMNAFDLITMTNDGTKGDEVLQYFGVDKEKIVFLMNGISENILKSKTKYIVNENLQIKLCSISRIIGWKRVYLLIEILNQLVNKHHITAVFVEIYGKGDAGNINYLEKLIEEYNLMNYVSIKGEVEHEQVPIIMQNNDFILSLYKHTNVTNPLLEAIYINVPIVSLEDSSLLKIIKNDPNRNIFLFKESDSEEVLVNSIADFFATIDINEVRNRRLSNNQQSTNEILTWNKRVSIEVSKIEGLLHNLKRF